MVSVVPTKVPIDLSPCAFGRLATTANGPDVTKPSSASLNGPRRGTNAQVRRIASIERLFAQSGAI
jgi:hypothetical protein